CALAAAPGTGRDRRGLAAAAAGLAIVGVGVVRMLSPGSRILPAVLLGAVLLTGVTLVAWDRPGGRVEWRWQALAALAALLAPAAMGFLALLTMAWLEPVAPLTALAGNTTINADGTDVLYSLAGLLAGLGTALLLAWPPALGERRPGFARQP
ncbi:hypothetical protein, partial [Micromonospora sp. NPDC049799]|uniref:hypothetical protein n=1 Tax=Micromonospora sp. NPDC049799 TaxID=3154741 RepID=UPI0033DED9FF